MEHLKGRVALVTGSSRGIGHAIALRLAEAGADVVVHGRNPEGPTAAAAEALRDRIREMGRRAEVLFADFTD